MHSSEKAGATDRAVGELELPKIVLQIMRGVARHKSRQVARSVFVIGTAPDCDLVLGDPRFDAVYSYLFVRADSVTIRQLGGGPQLHVGGQAVSRASLADLDLLEMGPYAFQVKIEWPAGVAPAAPATAGGAQLLQIPIDREAATQRLLDDVQQYSPTPRLSLFVGDGQYADPRTTRPLSAARAARHTQKKASF